MNREGCSCRAKGRLLIRIESECANKVRIMLKEANNFCDFYTIYIENGVGEFRADGISLGLLSIETNIDGKNTIYYPNNVILFEKNNYVHKLKIIDRRKKDEV